MGQLPVNFTDVFAFLMPGLVLIGIVAGPHLVEIHLGAALLTVVLAYVVGLVLHEGVRPWVPSAVEAGGRLPSSALLDPGRLPDTLRAVYVERVRRRFDLEVDAPGPARDQALMLARSLLAAEGRARYAEQSQAMQTLCRGLVAAGALGAAWLIGIAAGVVPTGVGLLLLLVGVFAAGRAAGWLDRLFDGGAMLALPLAAVGFGVGGVLLSPVVTAGGAVLALLAALAAVGLAAVARAAHDRYARAFAEEVIRGFVVVDLSESR
jgi:hypothetical protein